MVLSRQRLFQSHALQWAATAISLSIVSALFHPLAAYSSPASELKDSGGETSVSSEKKKDGVVSKESSSVVPAVPTVVSPYDSTPTVIEAPPPTTPLPKSRKKIGLALGGGGTRGAAHIGVLSVLEKEGIPFDMIVGTSMGAVVGGLYSAGLSIDEIEHRFEHGLMKSFLTVPIPVRIAAIPIFYVPRLFGYKPYDGSYVGGRFRNYINKSLPPERQAIENLKTPFGAVALNLLNGQAYCITRGNVGVALQASAALPVLRRPVKIKDGLFVDGGVVANLPVTEAKAFGADVVLAVDVDERFETMPDSAFRKIGSVARRVLTLHLAKVDENQIKDADFVIHPEVNGISLVSTKKKNIRAAVVAGEDAARKALPELRKKLGSILETRSPASE